MRKLLTASLVLLSVACGERAAEAPPQVQEARREAARQACLARDLARSVEDQLATLEGTLPAEDSGDPIDQITRSATRAAVQFSRALHQHALLREAALAHSDSAVNHARQRADSLRHTETAARFAIRLPEPGTVEANVIAEYERRLRELLADQDHPCNWDLEI